MSNHIEIEGFDPFAVTIDPGATFSGVVEIVLPPIRFNVARVNLLQANVMAEGRVFSIRIDFGEVTVTASKLLDFLHESEGDLRRMWEIAGEGLNKKPLLGDLL